MATMPPPTHSRTLSEEEKDTVFMHTKLIPNPKHGTLDALKAHCAAKGIGLGGHVRRERQNHELKMAPYGALVTNPSGTTHVGDKCAVMFVDLGDLGVACSVQKHPDAPADMAHAVAAPAPAPPADKCRPEGAAPWTFKREGEGTVYACVADGLAPGKTHLLHAPRVGYVAFLAPDCAASRTKTCVKVCYVPSGAAADALGDDASFDATPMDYDKGHEPTIAYPKELVDHPELNRLKAEQRAKALAAQATLAAHTTPTATPAAGIPPTAAISPPRVRHLGGGSSVFEADFMSPAATPAMMESALRLPTAADVETRTPPAASPALEAAHGRHRVYPGVFVVQDFAQTELQIDPGAIFAALIANYPVRRGSEPIVQGTVAWVDGSHDALHYRGNPVARCKIWAQRGSPMQIGFLRYGYTGWQWAILAATVDAAQITEIEGMLRMYDEWCVRMGVQRPNHYIITKYEDGTCGIDWHYDKLPDITPDSLITVVKLGEHARPFALRRRLFLKDSFPWIDPKSVPSGTPERKRLEEMLAKQKAAFQKLQDAEPPIFCSALAPGTAVIMTLKANEYTQHAVPQTAAELTGSIVFRSISKVIPPHEAAATIAIKAKEKEARAAKKRARDLERATSPEA